LTQDTWNHYEATRSTEWEAKETRHRQRVILLQQKCQSALIQNQELKKKIVLKDIFNQWQRHTKTKLCWVDIQPIHSFLRSSKAVAYLVLKHWMHVCLVQKQNKMNKNRIELELELKQIK
jgi:hypothetical protein